MLERNQIYCMDAFELMAQLPDGSVDMVLTDMPYNITACEWESEIDLTQFWLHVRRIVKPKAAVVCTASQPFTSRLVMSNLAWYKYCWYWQKSQATGFAIAKMQPLRIVEDIVVFNAGYYYPQGLVRFNQIVNKGKLAGGEINPGGLNSGKDYLQEWTNYPYNVLRFRSVPDTVHPTQKPVALFEYLIRTYTQAGDLILDPFIGSGTTAVAARNLDRHFIGCDLSQEYIDIANKRLALPYNVPLPGLE